MKRDAHPGRRPVMPSVPALYDLGEASEVASIPRTTNGFSDATQGAATASAPRHTIGHRTSMRPTVSLVIPARNEARNLARVLSEVPGSIGEVILVDGHSTDVTKLMAISCRPDIRIVSEDSPGKGHTLRAGFAAACGDIIVAMDADGSMAPAEIPNFVYFLENGFDFVKGSRFVAGGGSLDLTTVRRLGNRALLGLANTLYRTKLTDLCYGFFAFYRKYLDHLDLASSGFEIETELTVRAVRAGLRIAEIPSMELPRRSGRSNLHSLSDGARVLRTLLPRADRRRASGVITCPELLETGRDCDRYRASSVCLPVSQQTLHGSTSTPTTEPYSRPGRRPARGLGLGGEPGWTIDPGQMGATRGRWRWVRRLAMPFLNRADAGQQLAALLEHLRSSDVVVVGLPRGGVPVAFEVARALRAPLDVIVVRKLSVPCQPELAMGAIGESGARIVDERVVRAAGITTEEFAVVEARESAQLESRVARFRGQRAPVELRGRTVVVVDDGIATGSTARAACQVARVQGAARVVLAAPVAPVQSLAMLRRNADEVVCVETPSSFFAIGQFYDDFSPTKDSEVVNLLEEAGACGE